ncbi:putative triacylglycerol lipase [Rosa chinensis]|uniref:Putative triacylglycerol lipase n=1 Tax=Rosa chinensis TaxID=74649 RepID=A0A2P6PZ84_ROSCH|nr:GDSL esterase/lipase EXL3 isoform X1 [Rosa chinensis]PRQ27257.1 putative triacylglycerol lipase [Rosa chinensis]
MDAARAIVLPCILCYILMCNDSVGEDLTLKQMKLKIPANVSVPAVIVFGDSIVDTGNNNNNFITFARCNFLPYGIDFQGGRATGRFSNGKVPADLVVEAFGIKELLPPYMDPSLEPNDLLTGVNFAAGGVGYDPLTSEVAAVESLSDQMEQFKGYIEKLKGIVGEKRTNFIISNSLILVVAGSNDISSTYFVSGIRKLHFDVPSYTDFLLNHASQFFKELYGLGARRIGVFGVPAIGCVPSQRTIGGGIGRHCAENQNQAAELFNSKLSAETNHLRHTLPNSKFVYIDVYNPLLDIITNSNKYGFEVADKGCCGTGLVEVTKLCNKFQRTCTDTSKYVFWDSYHPTERANRILLQQLLTQSASGFF